jgi:hypothetical protein
MIVMWWLNPTDLEIQQSRFLFNNLNMKVSETGLHNVGHSTWAFNLPGWMALQDLGFNTI